MGNDHNRLRYSFFQISAILKTTKDGTRHHHNGVHQQIFHLSLAAFPFRIVVDIVMYRTAFVKLSRHLSEAVQKKAKLF